MNLHSLGMKLTESLRPSVAGHFVRLERGGLTTDWFKASSPPHGQDIITSQGVELSSVDRVFYFRVADLGMFGLPMRGDKLQTHDGKIYSLRPGESTSECWTYHGQHETSIRVIGKLNYAPDQ